MVPAMGNHLVDLTGPEFQKQPFTRSWIFGAYGGRIIFYEEMVAHRTLVPAAAVVRADQAAEGLGDGRLLPDRLVPPLRRDDRGDHGVHGAVQLPPCQRPGALRRELPGKAPARPRSPVAAASGRWSVSFLCCRPEAVFPDALEAPSSRVTDRRSTPAPAGRALRLAAFRFRPMLRPSRASMRHYVEAVRAPHLDRASGGPRSCARQRRPGVG